VVQGLLRALGDEGTLFMPALSYESVTASSPLFDVRRTPSCVGALSEYFRTRPSTLRGVHPTHSVCGVGRLAAELLADHELDTTPCGPHSPFRRLPDVGGQVLFLGCGLRPNTSMHAVEELVEPPYLYGPLFTYRLHFADGSERAQVYRRHGFIGYRQCYDRLAYRMSAPDLQIGCCLDAVTHLIDAEAMWSAALATYCEVPFYFVEKMDEDDEAM